MDRSPHPERSKEEIGRRLQALRTALGMDSRPFAETIGAAPNTYSHWETGRNLPDIYAMMRVWDEYGVDLNYLYMGRTASLPGDLRAKVAAALNEFANAPSDLAELQAEREASTTVKRARGRPRKTVATV